MAGSVSRIGVALLGSFVVYFIPLFGPHAVWFVGTGLVAGLTTNRSLAWMAADAAVALLAQAAAGLALYWSLARGWVRKLVWLGIIPLTVTLNFAFLSAIPTFFLVEPDTASEVNTWTVHCFVRGIELRPAGASAVHTASGARAWWAARAPDGRDTLLRVPECVTADPVLPTPGKSPEGFLDFFTTLQSSSPDGAAIVEQMDRRTGERSWWMLADPGAALHRLAAPRDARQASPVVSRRGDAVAYLTEIAGSGPPVLSRVLVRKTTPESTVVERDIDLSPLGPASYVVLDVEADAQEVLLWRDERPVVVTFDGEPRLLPFDPGDIRAQSSTYIRAGDGWVAWDAYKDEGPYQIAWSLGGRSGRHRTNAGRSVTSATVDPGGSYVAISETTTLSIGNAKDVVYVLRTGDGSAVFRRYLPRYSRSQVAFFEGGLFGYSDSDGTYVLKIPPQ